jgi:hypothetical protein
LADVGVGDRVKGGLVLFFDVFAWRVLWSRVVFVMAL